MAPDPEEVAAALGIPVDGALRDTGDRRAALWALAPAVLGAALAVVLTVTVGWIAGLVALVVALGLAAVAHRRARVWVHWSNPQLFLPSNAPLRLGDEVRVRFRRAARRRGGAAGSTVTARLRCVEAVDAGAGGGTGPSSEVVLDEPLEVRLHPGVDEVECDIAVSVPLFDAPPSMSLPGNRVSWEIVVHIEAPEAPDDDSTFAITVAPEVALR